MSDGLDRLRLAARMSGHGLHPDHVVRLCRHYLDVDLLPGSHPLNDDQFAQINAELDRAVELHAARDAALHDQPPTAGEP
jgi:hypothetical protein